MRIIVLGTRQLPADTTAEAIERYSGLNLRPEAFTTAALAKAEVRATVGRATLLVYAATERLARRPGWEVAFERPPALVIVDDAGYVTPEEAALRHAQGYVGAGASIRTVGERVAEVVRGGRAFPERATARAVTVAQIQRSDRGGTPELSETEREILRLKEAGQTTKEIAAALGRTQYQIDAHLRHLRGVFKVRTTLEAVAVALERGVISVPGSDPRGAAHEKLLDVEGEEDGG